MFISRCFTTITNTLHLIKLIFLHLILFSVVFEAHNVFRLISSRPRFTAHCTNI